MQPKHFWERWRARFTGEFIFGRNDSMMRDHTFGQFSLHSTVLEIKHAVCYNGRDRSQTPCIISAVEPPPQEVSHATHCAVLGSFPHRLASVRFVPAALWCFSQYDSVEFFTSVFSVLCFSWLYVLRLVDDLGGRFWTNFSRRELE